MPLWKEILEFLEKYPDRVFTYQDLAKRFQTSDMIIRVAVKNIAKKGLGNFKDRVVLRGKSESEERIGEMKNCHYDENGHLKIDKESEQE